jgi:uncharacterized membrane protein (UPF0136 family)
MQIVNNNNFGFHNKRSFVLFEKWVLANLIAELLGLGIIAFVGAIFPTYDNQNSQIVLILSGVFQGLILGVAQWLVLRRYMRNSIWWVLATIIGCFFGWLLVLFVSAIALFTVAVAQEGLDSITVFLGVIWLVTAVGMLIGLPQGLILLTSLKVKFYKAVWWMNVNALAWILRLFLVFTAPSIISDRVYLNTVFVMFGAEILMTLAYSGITGVILVNLLQSSLRKRYPL